MTHQEKHRGCPASFICHKFYVAILNKKDYKSYAVKLDFKIKILFLRKVSWIFGEFPWMLKK